MPSLAAIAAYSGLSIRRIRYVIDQKLLPGSSFRSRGRGAVRVFTHFEAFGISVAAMMLEAGLKRKLVQQSMKLICKPASRRGNDAPLLQAFDSQKNVRLEIGDWQHIRLAVVPEPSSNGTWHSLYGTGTREAYHPIVTLAIDVGQIRGQIHLIGNRTEPEPDDF